MPQINYLAIHTNTNASMHSCLWTSACQRVVEHSSLSRSESNFGVEAYRISDIPLHARYP
jgi:hypothetical protein